MKQLFKHIFIIAGFIFVCAHLHAQTKQSNKTTKQKVAPPVKNDKKEIEKPVIKIISVMYVDNSKPPGNDEGINNEIISVLDSILDSFKTIKNHRFIFFASNGNKPVVAEKQEQAETESLNLRKGNYLIPVFETDENLLRKNLVLFPYGDVTQVNFYYFVSDYFCQRLADESVPFIRRIPQQLSYLYNLSGKTIDVHLYFSNQSQKVDVKSLEKKLNFYSSDENLKSSIRFHLIKI